LFDVFAPPIAGLTHAPLTALGPFRERDLSGLSPFTTPHLYKGTGRVVAEVQAMLGQLGKFTNTESGFRQKQAHVTFGRYDCHRFAIQKPLLRRAVWAADGV